MGPGWEALYRPWEALAGPRLGRLLASLDEALQGLAHMGWPRPRPIWPLGGLNRPILGSRS